MHWESPEGEDRQVMLMYKPIKSIDTAGARIIERSQGYKSTVKYRTFVLLQVPIPRGVGKFNHRTGPGKH